MIFHIEEVKTHRPSWNFHCFNKVSNRIVDRDDQEWVAHFSENPSTKRTISEGKIQQLWTFPVNFRLKEAKINQILAKNSSNIDTRHLGWKNKNDSEYTSKKSTPKFGKNRGDQMSI